MKVAIAFVAAAAFLALAAAERAAATSYYVRTDGDDSSNGLSWAAAKATPGAAITAATNHGDEVVVSNGAYLLTAAITLSKSIALRSANNDFNSVVFDGAGSNRLITINTTATNALVAGITISNFVSGGDGAAFSLPGARSAVISNCLITCCTPVRGTIYMKAGTFVDSVISSNAGGTDCTIWNYAAIDTCRFIRCLISNNVSPVAALGVDRHSQIVEVTDCTFANNKTVSLYIGSYGTPATGVVTSSRFLANSNVALQVRVGACAYVTNCDFVGNKTGNAGAMYFNGGIGNVYGCAFISNSAVPSFSGGLNLSSAGVTTIVERCSFLYNTGYRGGAAKSAGTSGGCSVFRNCLFAGNDGTEGGALYVDYNTRLENCTVVNNNSPSYSGIYFRGQGSPSVVEVINTICYSNSPVNFAYYATGTYTFAYSCVAPTGTVNYVWGDGNITNSPVFMNSGAGYGTNCIVGDLQLHPGSPCKNAGTNLTWMDAAVDLAGNPRIAFGRADMGAYEVVQVKGTLVVIE